MHNDTDDDLDSLPNGRIEPQLSTSTAEPEPLLSNTRPVQQARSKGVGLLSALTLAIVCSSAAFGWWSVQRLQLLEQQLVATQDSFSKTSESAAGRIQEITGQVHAAQSSVASGTTSLKKRIEALESSAVDIHKQQHTQLTEHSSDLSKLSRELTALTQLQEDLTRTLEQQRKTLTQHSTTLTELKPTLAQHSTALATLQSELSQQLKTQHTQVQQLASTLKAQQDKLADIDQLSAQVKTLSTQARELQSNTSSTDDITRLQQDMLILRSELDQRPKAQAAPQAKPAPSLADFDAYRAQTNRTITALQEQIRNLQKNTP